ncbi:putative mRNA capping enzyme [Corchorus olitorius]|uniref:mRNA capping enzyme n=1 Tax=Corchorus olitorius TaxID=93759 RepID=A0A1R3KUA8_9ROSI|nr:putative mRNA capping enzyme [Corchorus olitorius]
MVPLPSNTPTVAVAVPCHQISLGFSSPPPDLHIADMVLWSNEEEQVLFECFLSVPRLGEGYGSGWIQRVELMFNTRVPGKNPGQVAIISKLRMMRREYGLVRLNNKPLRNIQLVGTTL